MTRFISSVLVLACVAEAGASQLEVHVVPHSHQDEGYKKTAEGYFETMVSRTLHSIAHALTGPEAQHRRFIWSEVFWLARWFEDPSFPASDKVLLTEAIERGQIELVDGGWAQHDDAATSLEAQVNNLEVGHAWLAKQFGEKYLPRVGWHPDPFGPTSVDPTLFALSGYDAFFTNRIPDDQKQARKASRELEFIWHGSNHLPAERSALFTHVMDTDYSSVPGFDWEQTSNPDGITNPAVTSSNIQNLSDTYVAEMVQRSDSYMADPATQQKILMVPFGADFEFQNASWQFQNMDKLVAYINSNTARYQQLHGINVSIRYSTLSGYLQGLGRLNITYPKVVGSPFIPFWSGYYSGYPTIKREVRLLEQLLRQAEIWTGLMLLSNEDAANSASAPLLAGLKAAKGTSAVMTHHDNTPGTGYFWNTRDTILRTEAALRILQEQVLPGAISSVVAHVSGNAGIVLGQAGIVCPPMGSTAQVLVMSSTLRRQSEFVELTVCRDDLLVEVVDRKTDDESAVPADVFRSQGDGVFRLRVGPIDVPPLGWTTLRIRTCSLTHDNLIVAPGKGCTVRATENSSLDGISQSFGSVEGQQFSMGVSEEGGLAWLYSKAHQVNVSDPLSFVTYGADGSNTYYFQPTSPPTMWSVSKWGWLVERGNRSTQVVLTPLVATDDSLETLTITVSDDEPWLRLEVRLRELPRGINFVMRLAGLGGASPAQSWTYLENGYEPQPGRFNASQSIGSSYFPMTHGASVCALKACTLLATQQTLGQTVLPNGSIEVMLHRRIPTDAPEGWAPQSFLKGDDSAGATIQLQISAVPTELASEALASFLSRQAAPLLTLEESHGLPFVASSFGLSFPSESAIVHSHDVVSASLPDNLHLLSMAPDGEGGVSARWRHLGFGESDMLNLSSIAFSMGPSWEVARVEERGLTMQRLNRGALGAPPIRDAEVIKMDPYDIRSFKLQLVRGIGAHADSARSIYV